MADNPAQHFADMAARIAMIDPTEFAGAIVVVPHDGEPIAFLTADPSPDLVQFWATCQTRIEVRKAEVLAEAQDKQSWRQR